MAVTAVDWAMGSSQQNIRLPSWLQGRREILGVQVGIYRSFIIAICGALAIGLQLALMRTRFGSRLRAAVDDARVARGLGIPLGTELLGLDPNFPLKFMIYFLIVVTVGGTSGIIGPFVASLLLGVADVAGKYYVPALGAFMVYLVMIAVLVLRPHGLFARPR
jgi:branched-chain amino acid transport system permease protein